VREHEIKGLMDLRRDYQRQLSQLRGYQDLSNDFRSKALDLIRDGVNAAGLNPQDVPVLRPSPGGGGGGPVAGGEEGCGFCTVCITSCTGCVFHVSD
jgi:hypothetical protein